MRLTRSKGQESCCSFWKTYSQSAYSSRGTSHHHYGSARCSDAGLPYSVGDFHAEPAVRQWVRENIPARGTVMDRQTKHGVCLASPREKESHGVGRMILVDDVQYPVAVLIDDMSDACGRKCCAAHSCAVPEPLKFMPFLLMESSLGQLFPELGILPLRLSVSQTPLLRRTRCNTGLRFKLLTSP